MASVERTLLQKLNLRQDVQSISATNLNAFLLFLWSASQEMRRTSHSQSSLDIFETLHSLLREHGKSYSGRSDIAKARSKLQKIGVLKVHADAGNAGEWTGVCEEYSKFLRNEHEKAAWIVSAILLRFFPFSYEEVLEDIDLGASFSGRVRASLLPYVGDAYPSREKISIAYGGNLQRGITPMDDGYVSVFSKQSGPYSDGVIGETGWIAYIGEGLTGDQNMIEGNKSLLRSQERKVPVRYWRQQPSGVHKFESWTVVVQRRWQWGIGDDNRFRKEFVWVLAPVASADPRTWPVEIKRVLNEGSDGFYDDTLMEVDEDSGIVPKEPMGESSEYVISSYGKLNDNAKMVAENRGRDAIAAESIRRLRSPSARLAVIWRSRGTCENPECFGHSFERTTRGWPILEVDHLSDLAKGGSDVPRNMIALCPNCHALKTRGEGSASLKRKLVKVAVRRHNELLSDWVSG